MNNKVKTYLISILIPVIIGAVVGLIISPSMNYEELVKPFLAPPGIVFPIVWTILYIIMGISYGMLKTKDLTDKETDLIYYVQLIVNALWSIIFFTFKLRFLALVWILLLAVLVIIMIIKFIKKDKISGFLQIPYLLWVLFATYLNLSFYILNK